jgi:phosphatidylglycerophosphatase A
MITFAAAAGRYALPAIYILAGFGLFRFFDGVKPFPVRRLERFPNGIGVVADDVGAGLISLGVLTLIQYIAGS